MPEKRTISAKLETFVALIILLVICFFFAKAEYYAQLEREHRGAPQTRKLK